MRWGREKTVKMGEQGWRAGGSVARGGWEDYICWVAISNSDHEIPNIPTRTLDADQAERTERSDY